MLHEEPWCSGLTCLPVTQKIAGSNPVGSGFASVQDDNSVTNGKQSHPGHWHSSFKQERKQSRPGPANPQYGIPPEKWADVLHRIEQGEPLRQIAQDYGVSYETIRRTVKAAHKREKGEK